MKFFHTDICPTFPDNKTGRPLYYNSNPEFFFIIPNADFGCLAQIGKDAMNSNFGISSFKFSRGKAFDKYVELFMPVFNARAEQEFKCAIESLFGFLETVAHMIAIKKTSRTRTSDGVRAMFSQMLIRLWSEGVILFPCGIFLHYPNVISNIFGQINMTVTPMMNWPEEWAWLNQNHEAMSKINKILGHRIIVSIGPSPRLDHINDDVAAELGKTFTEYGYLESNGYDEKSKSSQFSPILMFFRFISLKQKAAGQNSIDVIRFNKDFNASESASKRRNNTFRHGEGFYWATNVDPSLELFRADVHEWFINGRDTTSNSAGCKTCMNKLFDYLIANPSQARIPQNFIRDNGHDSATLVEFLVSGLQAQGKTKTLKICASFFDWVLEKYAVITEDNGEKIPLPGFCNPIPDDLIPGYKCRDRFQTDKIPLPAKFVQMIKDILLEDNFKWARTKESEYFNYLDPDTGELRKVFSPIRTYVLLLLLILPVRLKQIRMLDSGEGDSEKYSPDGLWVTNDSKHAGTVNGKGNGVIRKMINFETGENFTGFYINTNKTGDIGKSALERGYDIPWSEPDAIKLLTELRDWQETYNPVDGPTQYTETTDGQNTSQADIDRSPDRFYLFRNPCSDASHLPIGHDEISSFFENVLKELEDRLAKEKRTNKNGSLIKLFNSNGTPIFSIHSLRVTGLTALAMKGVPFDILSKLVAGHSTVLMTLYYMKYTAGYINNILNAASQESRDKAEEDLESYLQDYHLGSPKKYTSNSEDAFTQAKKQPSGCWKSMDHGVCPNGGTLCYQGWKKEVEVEGKTRVIYTSIPHEGSVGCGLCRFILTGPAWLLGLEAKINEILVMSEEVCSTMMKLLEEKQRLEQKRLHEGAAFIGQRALYAAEQNSQSATRNSDQILMIKQALVNLAILSCELGKQMIEEGSDKLPIIYQCEQEELEIHIVECSKFDLYDNVCQNSVWYKSINPNLANLRRAKKLDRTLSNNGKRPVFFHLSEDAQLIAGNALSLLFLNRCGRKGTNDLIDGSVSLDQLRIRDDEMEMAMVEACNKALLPAIDRDTNGGITMTWNVRLSLSAPVVSGNAPLLISTGQQGSNAFPAVSAFN